MGLVAEHVEQAFLQIVELQLQLALELGHELFAVLADAQLPHRVHAVAFGRAVLEELQTPQIEARIEAQAENQRRILVPQGTQQDLGRARRCPSEGMGHGQEARVLETGLHGQFRLAFDDGHVVPVLGQVIGRGRTHHTAAHHDCPHSEPPFIDHGSLSAGRRPRTAMHPVYPRASRQGNKAPPRPSGQPEGWSCRSWCRNRARLRPRRSRKTRRGRPCGRP